jgi:hypothetical protein
MKFRKLRIAWSAACGTACVLLIVLWVRSYMWGGSLVYVDSTKACISVISDRGILVFAHNDRVDFVSAPSSWKHFSWPSEGQYKAFVWTSWLDDWHGNGGFVTVPYWLLVFLAGTFSTIPCLCGRRRFSLRTLLIATTLVAVALGTIVWLALR